MSIRRVLEMLIVQKTTGDGVSKVSADLRKVKDEMSDVEKEIAKGVNTSAKFGGTWDMVLLGINQGIQIVREIAQAFEHAYGVMREGAELEFTQRRFDLLSDSIDTTAILLRGDLRDATRGLYSDAQLMADAGDMMALGLAKTHDEALRLATVAGALNMNMNQLTLTLTNMTTMRFDTLGVSVDGFKERVKELEAAGLSADAAFKEAFLQQAEAQIEKVGAAADTTLGSFMRLEAGVQNLGDSLKAEMAEAFEPFVKLWADEFSVMTANREIEILTDGLKELGYTAEEIESLYQGKTFFFFDEAGAVEASSEAIQIYRSELERFYAELEENKELNRYLVDPFYDGAAALEDATVATENFLAEYEKITSLDTNFRGMVRLAEQYDTILGQIGEKQQRIQALMAISETGGYLDGAWVSARNAKEEMEKLTGEVGGLQDKMAEMANQVVLDMFMATIAVDGVTKAEADAYFRMAADMGIISREAAAEAMRVYGEAIDYINKLKINDKSATYTVTVQTIGGVTIGGGGWGAGGQSPQPRQEGGVVYPGQRYRVGELGVEEVVFDQPARVISNRDIQNAAGGAGTTIAFYGPVYMRTEEEIRDVLEQILVDAARG